jgi:hypothetical protein
MNTLKTLDKEISSYLPRLSPRQKQTVLTVVKTFAEEDEEEIWNDASFIAEMDKRFSEMESGKVKTFSLEEVEKEARLYNKGLKKKG